VRAFAVGQQLGPAWNRIAAQPPSGGARRDRSSVAGPLGEPDLRHELDPGPCHVGLDDAPASEAYQLSDRRFSTLLHSDRRASHKRRASHCNARGSTILGASRQSALPVEALRRLGTTHARFAPHRRPKSHSASPNRVSPSARSRGDVSEIRRALPPRPKRSAAAVRTIVAFFPSPPRVARPRWRQTSRAALREPRAACAFATRTYIWDAADARRQASAAGGLRRRQNPVLK
jgi:hypothetical protein